MIGYVSRDGHWTVTVISIDGRSRIRIEHDTVLLPDGHAVPVHWDRTGKRCGTVGTAHGFLVAEVRTVADVSRYVPLSELVAARY